MNNYFLIARNKKDNLFQVIGINEKWYLGSEGRDCEHYACSLEAIDLVTSQFSSREQLSKRLCDRGYIKSSDVDIFIASKNTVGGKDYIQFDEVIYNPSNNRRMREFRKVADASLADSMVEDCKDELDYIFEDIIMTSYSADDLYSIIMDGNTSISKDIVNLLSGIMSYGDVPLELRREREFRRSSYRTVRNIVETLNRFDLFSKCSRDDRYLASEVFIEENKADRMALVPKLAFGLDADYGTEQMMLDGYFTGEDERVRNATKKITREEKVASFIPNKTGIPRIVVNDRISVADKKKEIFRVLRKLPTNVFKNTNGKYQVNYDLFRVPVYEEERKQLDSLLTGNLPKYFTNYAMHNYQYGQACKYNPVGSELSEIRNLMEWDLASIKKRFRSYKCVNDAYTWCMLWDGCMRRNSEYGNGSEKGDCGKTYGKR